MQPLALITSTATSCSVTCTILNQKHDKNFLQMALHFPNLSFLFQNSSLFVEHLAWFLSVRRTLQFPYHMPNQNSDKLTALSCITRSRGQTYFTCTRCSATKETHNIHASPSYVPPQCSSTNAALYPMHSLPQTITNSRHVSQKRGCLYF